MASGAYRAATGGHARTGCQGGSHERFFPAAANGPRLEIAPALASDAAHAGTTTGTAAGSEGDMLGNEQLRQAREDIATAMPRSAS